MNVRTLVAAVATVGALGTTLVAPPTAVADAAGTTSAGVGPGWFLTTVDHGTREEWGIDATSRRLVLVGPDGQRRQVLERPVRRGGFRLADWSPDGRTALLIGGTEAHQRAIRVDVATGETAATKLPSDVATAVLAPDGDGVLATGYQNSHGQAPLFTIGWDGTRTDLAPDVDGPVLPSGDGATLVTGGASWRNKVVRVLSASDGTVERRIPTTGHCQPVRWWDDHRVLLRCSGRTGATSLSLADVATGTVRALTTRAGERGSQDLGDLDARRIDSGLYLQVAGPCGYVYLGKHHLDGSVTKVDVPHAVGSVDLLGGSGRWLVIEHAMSCDGSAPRSAIARFDPVTKRERVLTALPRDEAFGRFLAYGERQPTGF